MMELLSKTKECEISLHRLRYSQLLILLELSIYLYYYLNQLCLYFSMQQYTHG